MNKTVILTFITAIFLMHFALFEAATSKKNVNKWSDKQIYFIFDEQFKEDSMRVIRNAVAELQKIVCVNITEVTDRNWRTPDNKQPVHIINSDGCWSHVGFQKDKDFQEISLRDASCHSDSTAKHEFMHLLGLSHEQSRTDRDQFIDYKEDRIKDPNQFAIRPGLLYGDFDFQSNMLYPPWGMAKFPHKQVYSVKAGQGKHDEILKYGSISFQDAFALNRLYRCGNHCEDECEDEDAYQDKDCNCITPDSFAEQQCFDIRTDCKAWKHECLIDSIFTSECRKTCKTCYKSPNGVGERGGTMEICDDIMEYANGYCKTISEKSESEIDEYCYKNPRLSYYCRKTCDSGCLIIQTPKVGDVCQDFFHNCAMFKAKCSQEKYQYMCAKTCGSCGAKIRISGG